MSWWASIDATLIGDKQWLTEEEVRQRMPTGSEDGPSVFVYSEGPGKARVSVDGRLRDFIDGYQTFETLAWFARLMEWAVDEGTLHLSFDSGPSYRYRYTKETGLERLRGVLD